MTNQSQVSVGNRDIYSRTDGAINGDVVTVASVIVWADDKSPIDDLIISDKFLSGNHLPVGDLKATNQYYDKETGTFWFDVKLKAITEQTTITLQTTGTVNGVEFPVRFEFTLAGPSPLVVSPITFDGNKMEFAVSAKEGRLLRYPLALLAYRNLDGNADAPASKEKKIPYSFYVTINNNETSTYAVMGQAEVDGVKHNFVARTTVTTSDGTMTVNQIGENLIGVDIKLAKASNYIGVGFPLKFQFSNGTYGIVNRLENFSIQGDVVHFEFPVNDIKAKDVVTLAFHLTEADNQNAPIFFKGKADVKRWSHGQTKINIVVDSHTFKRTLQSLYMSVFWEDGTPVTGFSVKNVKPDAEVGGKGNKIIIARSVTPNIHKRNKLTLSGEVDLSAFGIDEVFPFSESIEVGSDILPVRLVSGLGTVDKDEVFFHIAVRQNNGDIFKDVILKTFNGDQPIKHFSYDVEQGIIAFSVPNTAINVKEGRANIDLELIVTADEQYTFNYKGAIKVDVPYSVTVDKPSHSFRKDPVTSEIIIDAVWQIKGSDNKFPLNVNVTQVMKNGSGASYTKSYNSGTGLLTVSMPVGVDDGKQLYIEPTVTVSGLGTFATLPGLSIRYNVPGKATYAGHEFRDGKLAVYFSIRGWMGYYPDAVQIDDNSWNKQQGVKLGKTYSEYDKDKGQLIVIFDIFDLNAPVFSAETHMKFDFADSTTYPISFSFSK